jgi:hypothetical protein
MIANTTDPDGIYKAGSGCLSASEFKVAGGYDDSLNTGCPLDPAPETSIPPADDPLASLPSPPYIPCSGGANPSDTYNGSANVVIPKGRHCKNIRINLTGGAIATLEQGTHVFDGSSLKIQGSSIVEGTGVTLYWSENVTGVNGGIDVAGTTSVTLSAPISGTFAGILLYQDRNTTASVNHMLTGGSTMDLDGIIYAPTTDITFAGGNSVDSSSIVIISDKVTFQGGSTFLGDFDTSSILNNAMLLQAKLVE